MKADIKAVTDRGEAVSMMEPLLIAEGSRHRAVLTDLVVELAQKSAGFRRSLPSTLLTSLARLMSHAMLLETLDTGAVWSVARGLARNVDRYKALLAACDAPRRNDLDGRGDLSEEALARFTEFFLRTCIDQVEFMEGLMQPDRLRTRILLWAEEEIRVRELPPKSDSILEALLYRGELPRSDVAKIIGVGERHARRIVSALTKRGVLASESSRAPLRLVFPAGLASRWMPGLFPEKAN